VRIGIDSTIGTLNEMTSPLVLYSTNTSLAFSITQRYYGGIHYVWAAPYSGSMPIPQDAGNVLPPTSSPSDIFHNLWEEVQRGDRHSDAIARNKAGILRGISLKEAAGVINHRQAGEINDILNLAQPADFKPLLYVIPYEPIASLVREVPVDQRAHPLSAEYIIDALPRDAFDVMSLRR